MNHGMNSVYIRSYHLITLEKRSKIRQQNTHRSISGLLAGQHFLSMPSKINKFYDLKMQWLMFGYVQGNMLMCIKIITWLRLGADMVMVKRKCRLEMEDEQRSPVLHSVYTGGAA